MITSRTNKDLSHHEFIAMQNIKRAALALYDYNYNKAEECLGEALQSIYKINK